MKQAIGFFDSGVGGLSLLSAVEERLPSEDICYIADHAFSPYGEKAHTYILARAKQLTEVLIQKECKLIVIACNTVTTQVIDELRKEYSLPFVGIEPAIKPAALATKSKTVGLLATKGTLKSQLFHQNTVNHAAHIHSIEQIGNGLVDIVEDDRIHEKETFQLLSNYIQPMLDEGIDTLILGCTHYPFLIPVIQKIIPQSVRILDNSPAITKQIERVLIEHQLLKQDGIVGKKHYYTTGNVTAWRDVSFTHLQI